MYGWVKGSVKKSLIKRLERCWWSQTERGVEPITEGGEEGTPDIAEMLEGVLETMKARLEGPKV